MTPETVDRIFEPFLPTEGTDLGLAEVYGFAGAADGFIPVRAPRGSAR
jgi:hypothetical protein